MSWLTVSTWQGTDSALRSITWEAATTHAMCHWQGGGKYAGSKVQCTHTRAGCAWREAKLVDVIMLSTNGSPAISALRQMLNIHAVSQ